MNFGNADPTALCPLYGVSHEERGGADMNSTAIVVSKLGKSQTTQRTYVFGGNPIPR